MMWLCLSALAAPGELEEEITDEAALAGPDRSTRPAVTPPEPLALDDLSVHELAPGLTGLHVRVPRVRDVRVMVRSWRGSVELEGRSTPAMDLMDSAWTWASEKYDTDELSALEDVLDLSLSSNVSNHSVAFTMKVPKEDLEKGLDVMEDVYFHPTFAKKDLRVLKEQYHRYFTARGPKSPASVASAALAFAWTDSDHPYGVRPDPEAIQALKSKELAAVHSRLISEGPVDIVVVGDVDWATIEPLLKARFGRLGKKQERGEMLESEQPDATRVIAIDMPESEQALMRLRIPAPSRASDERVAMDAIGFALGGHFLARLNKNLREDKGWTYGTRAFYSANEKRGSFNISVDVPVDKFSPAVDEIEKELGLIGADGVTSDELSAFWRGEVMGFNATRGTVDDAFGTYSSLLFHEEQVADRVAWLDAIAATNPADTQTVAAKVFGTDAPRLWIVVGPRKELEVGFERLGWDPEWVGAEDAILGTFKGGRL